MTAVRGGLKLLEWETRKELITQFVGQGGRVFEQTQQMASTVTYVGLFGPIVSAASRRCERMSSVSWEWTPKPGKRSSTSFWNCDAIDSFRTTIFARLIDVRRLRSSSACSRGGAF